MNKQKQKVPVEETGLEDNVAAYLAQNPNFFERHLDLLVDLRLPHPSGGAVSLLERQIAALRSESESYRKQLEEFIAVARDNEDLNRRLHRLTLKMMDTGSLQETLNALQDALYDEFQADAVELRLFSGESFSDELQSTGEEVLKTFQDFLDRGQPVCGRLEPSQMQYLFGPQAGEISSAALMPLQAPSTVGILAIGSRSEDRFHRGKGTEFLVRLGEIVSRRLHVATLPGA